MKLRGKNVILTGGARVGKTVARMLAEEGMNILLAYRHSKMSALEAAENAKESGVKAWIFRADLARENEVKKLFQYAKKMLGRIDILIAMVSSFPLTPFKTLNEKIWNREIGNTLTSSFLCAKYAAALMQKQKSDRRGVSGKIMLIGDARIDRIFTGGGKAPGEKMPTERIPYHVAKAGVHMLTKLLALELTPRILVNCVAPGLVLPPDNMSEKIRKEKAKEMLLGKWGTPEDVGRAILSLLKNDYATGEIMIDSMPLTYL